MATAKLICQHCDETQIVMPGRSGFAAVVHVALYRLGESVVTFAVDAVEDVGFCLRPDFLGALMFSRSRTLSDADTFDSAADLVDAGLGVFMESECHSLRISLMCSG